MSSVGLAAAAPASAGNLSSQPSQGPANLSPAAPQSGAGYGSSDQTWQVSSPSQQYAYPAAPVSMPKPKHKSHLLLYSTLALTTLATAGLLALLLLRKPGMKANTNTTADTTANAGAAKNRTLAQAALQNEIKNGTKAAETTVQGAAPPTAAKAPEPKPATKTEESKPVEEGAKTPVPSKAARKISPLMWKLGGGSVALFAIVLAAYKTGYLGPVENFAKSGVALASARMQSGRKWCVNNGHSIKLYALNKIASIWSARGGASTALALADSSGIASSSNLASRLDDLVKTFKGNHNTDAHPSYKYTGPTK